MAIIHKVLKSYGVGALSKEKTLKAIFDTTSKDAWKTQKKIIKAKSEGDDSVEEHAWSSGEISAVLWKKGFKYNQNCHDYLETDSGRNKVFQEFPHIELAGYTDIQIKIFKEYFAFPGVMKCNFNPGAELKGKNKKAGCSKPYRWQGHHMIPGSAFYTKVLTVSNGATSKSLVFTDSQYKLLLLSDYNVNHGHNLIPLPANKMDRYQPIHSLIQHPSDHVNYTQMVQKKMKDVSDKLDEIKKNKKPHPNLKIKIAEQLRGLEDDLWDFIVKLSRQIIGAKLGAKGVNSLSKEQENVIKFKTKGKSPTFYEFGALG